MFETCFYSVIMPLTFNYELIMLWLGDDICVILENFRKLRKKYLKSQPKIINFIIEKFIWLKSLRILGH